jgi:DNA-binding protein YbaB
MKNKVLMIGFLFLLVISSCGYAQDAVTKSAEDYIQYFKNSDFKALYSNMSQKSQIAMSYEDLTDLIKIEKEILGNIIEYVNIETVQRTSEGVPETLLSYEADFEHGQGVITISIVKENNVSKIQVFHIDSPAFLKPKSKELLQSFQLKHK